MIPRSVLSSNFYQLSTRAFTLGCIAVLSSCGGGDTPKNSEQTSALTFSGTVAIGEALKNVAVAINCENSSTVSANSDNFGGYVASISGNLPCTFSVVEPKTGFVLRSLSNTEGTVNITPLTEAIFVFANGDTAKVVDAKSKLELLLLNIGSPTAGDPISQKFAADGTGIDKNILDLVSFTANTYGATELTGPNSLSNLPRVLNEINARCSAANTRCFKNESILAKISNIESREILRTIFDELDKQLFVGGGGCRLRIFRGCN